VLSARYCVLVAASAAVFLAGCSAEPAAPAPEVRQAPADSQHAGITEPHGDHSPHHGGIVLMNGDVHYEVVLDPAGRHAVWFTNAVREDLPASVAKGVGMRVARPSAAVEALSLAIDEAGESWIAAGQPVSGPDVVVSLGFEMRGEPHEIDLPFTPATK
jgi:hypothetical protein